MKTTFIAGGSILGIIVIAVGYWGISPIFRHVRVNESSPVVLPTAPVSAGAPITGTTGHPAEGTVRILESDGKHYIRYENFKTINGPDIYVYLAKDLDAKEYVNVGAVKATEGNVNYEIPSDVRVDEYTYVLTWCKTFGVLFNYARIK
jgi:hypothetical protein